MPQYGNIDRAILGLKADNGDVTRVESWAAQEDIIFGYPVFGYLGDEVKAYNYKLDVGKILWDADFEAGDTITVTVNGESTAAVPFNTDHDTTMDDIITAVSGLSVDGVGVDAALDPNDANNRTVFARLVGADVTVSVVVTGGTIPGDTITYQSDQIFLGVALYVSKDVNGSNQGGYFQYQACSIMNTGLIWAITDGSAVAGKAALLIASGADEAKFGVAGTLDVTAKFRSDDYTNETTTDEMAIVRVDGQKKLNTEIVWS